MLVDKDLKEKCFDYNHKKAMNMITCRLPPDSTGRLADWRSRACHTCHSAPDLSLGRCHSYSCRILTCTKRVYHLKHVRKVLALAFRVNRQSVCLRRYNFPRKTLKFAKTCYTATVCPQHGGTWRIANEKVNTNCFDRVRIAQLSIWSLKSSV